MSLLSLLRRWWPATTNAAAFRVHAKLRDGTRVCIRALRPDDRDRLRAAFHRLSPGTIYRRFFHPVTALTDDDLRELTELDFHDHVALAATVANDDGETMVAVARFIRVAPKADRAELAFTVADDYQRRGVSTLLLRHLVQLARERGIREFVASMLDDNRDMLGLIRNSGLPMRQRLEDGMRHVVVRLDA